MASNAVSREVVSVLVNGGGFDDIRDLVAGSRGRRVYESGDVDAGIWTTGMAQGLIHDIPTVDALVQRIIREARELIGTHLTALLA